MFMEGNVGVLSKSGALSYEVCKNLTENGIGQSTVVGIGGGPFWGMTQPSVLKLLEEDPETKVVVMLGEVGGTMELEAAEYIHNHMTKPVVALIVGRSAPEGAQMGHAGAIIEGKEGTAANKIAALKAANVQIAYRPAEIPQLIQSLGVL
jgi:succinyl-CoA synthetase alpha subunit